MAKIDITRTELVWPGKYNEDGTLREVPRTSLPFQVIETVNESRAAREAKKGGVQGTLFDVYDGTEGETFESGWRNKLIWGDNLLVMGSLLEKFTGKIDLVYIDPPFATGADFSFTVPVGESGESVFKEQSVIEEKAYRDTWGDGRDSYLAMMADRLRLIRSLLSPNGSFFLHCDWHVGHLLRSLGDEVFGSDHFLNEIIWYYYNKFQGNVNRFAANHDVILWYRQGESYHFERQIEKRLEGTVKQLVRVWDKEKGKIVNAKGPDGKVIYRETDEKTVDDVWRISMLQPADRTENCGFPTQKPEAVLRRILQAASRKGSLVADFFCGSGTTLAVAEKLGRRWIGCDLGRWGIHVTRKRLLGIENCKPFEVLNLGKYERQYWQGMTFGEAEDNLVSERSLYEYLAFILRLYGAQPVAGLTHIHGKKGKAMIHIGAVDAPVTIGEIDAALAECAELRQGELHVLGWEWEMGLYDLMGEFARKKGVRLRLLQIPREVMEQQAAAKGDVDFYELAYLEAQVSQPSQLTVQVVLKDFVIPNPELIPEDVRSKVTKWSDYIDYWAVDWDFGNDTFMQGWVTYRTRKDRGLSLSSDLHRYERPGKYRLLLKVIDIFGNDTSQAFDVEVR
ncbi:MAG: site-specific DNA-methyltransferase [Gemmatimonadetes bacterium]|nr:site-specific DNA-methyltransferase [Gammaproteobacteria bacterium]MYG81287.1 site-specific DNA-methyltransferase [Gemmatimonadota bacterium]